MLRGQILQAREQAQRLALDLGRQALRPLAGRGHDEGRLAIVDLVLLPGREAAGDALPQDQPLRLTLDVRGKRRPGEIQPARVRHPPVVERGAEARAQAVAEEVQPAGLVPGRSPPAIRHLEQGVGDGPHRAERPGLPGEPETLLEAGHEGIRRCRGIGAPAEQRLHEGDRVGHRAGIDHRGGRLGLLPAAPVARARRPKLELQAPAVSGRGGDDPQLERAELGVDHLEHDADVGVPGALAEAQLGHERRVPVRGRIHGGDVAELGGARQAGHEA